MTNQGWVIRFWGNLVMFKLRFMHLDNWSYLLSHNFVLCANQLQVITVYIYLDMLVIECSETINESKQS